MSSSEVKLEDLRIPLEEIMSGTANFSAENYIGGGGYGNVYKGNLSNSRGKGMVAIKQLTPEGWQGKQEFRNEVSMLYSYKHKNIVNFIGYCDEGNQMIIVYEYAVNGSLDKHLCDTEKMRSMPWEQRLKICIGAAEGLKYLHSGIGADLRVIHRDVKSSNILLDDNLEAKISDFGLSKFGPRNQPYSELNTRVAGTQGYCDPHYQETGELRKESDVYSFGVVLFEMLCGRLVFAKGNCNCNPDDDGDARSLVYLVRHNKEMLDKIIDHHIRDQVDPMSLITYKEIAYQCLEIDYKKRPQMDDVVTRLKEALYPQSTGKRAAFLLGTNEQTSKTEKPSQTSTTKFESLAPSAVVGEAKNIYKELALQILVADRLVKSAKELQPSEFDCSEVAKLAAQLTHLFRSTARLVASFSTTAFYDRPLRRISSDASKNLELAITLVRKCEQGSGFLRQVFAIRPITTTADIRKVCSLLESSISDLEWLLSIFASDHTGATYSLPPIASNEPILAWVWSYIATVQHASLLKDRVDAANALASLAGDNDMNKKMIIEEDGIPPLLKLLKEGASEESQITAVSALYKLATDEEKAAAFIRSLAVPAIVQVLNYSHAIVQVLNYSHITVQTNVINLVSKLAEMNAWLQEEFGRENVMRPIVTFLAIDVVLEEQKTSSGKPTSIHSIVQIKQEMAKISYGNAGLHSSSSLSLHNKKEREVDSLGETLKLKISCAGALWKLAKGSLLNSRKITETRALILLAKLIEKESGELQVNCLMTVMELAAVAESNADLRRQAFRPNSPSARAVLDQILRVMNEESNPKLVVPSIKSIGSLARTFPAKETRVIGPLVAKVEDKNGDIAIEAVIALANFVCPENFNNVEHSKTIIESDGIPRLMNFLRSHDNNIKGQVHGLKLLCYLALLMGDSKALEQARALSVIEGAAQSVVMQYPDLKELFTMTIHHLSLYQPETRTHRQACVP